MAIAEDASPHGPCMSAPKVSLMRALADEVWARRQGTGEARSRGPESSLASCPPSCTSILSSPHPRSVPASSTPVGLDYGVMSLCDPCCHQDLQMMTELLRASPYHEVRVNAAAMMGLTAKRADLRGLVGDVGTVLLQALDDEAHVLVVAEVGIPRGHLSSGLSP
jgi:hypothetical protein